MKKIMIVILLLSGCSKPQIKHAPIEPLRENITEHLVLLDVEPMTRKECDHDLKNCMYISRSNFYNALYNQEATLVELFKAVNWIEATKQQMEEHNKNNE